MTALWQHLDASQQLVLACVLTLPLGLFLGAAWTWWLVRVPQVVDDDPQSEYEAAADEVYDQAADDSLALAALRADLDEWGQ